MKKHMIWLIVALLVLALLLMGARALDPKIRMPLLSGTGQTAAVPADGTAGAQTDAAQAAAAVDALIAKIGTPVTADSRAAIEAARKAYEALPDEAKGKVSRLAELAAAEKALAALGDGAQTDAAGKTAQPGDTVTFKGGNVYVSANAAEPARVIAAESKCQVTYHVEDTLHPYHLISQDGGGVYGWVDAASVALG